MARKITLNSGLEKIEVGFEDRPETLEIYFNPADPDLITRFNEMPDRVEAALKDIPDVELGADGTPVNDGKTDIERFNELSDKVREIRKAVCDEIDRAFGNPISSEVFKFCNPFAIVKGNKRYVVHFIEAITPVVKDIAEEYSAEAEKEEKKQAERFIGKYVNKS